MSNNFQSDKLLHFLAGASCAAITCALWLLLFDNAVEAACVGGIAGFVAGVAKESIDHMLDKPFDARDMLATAIGSIAFSIIFLIYYWLL